jgi:hypothetical protein
VGAVALGEKEKEVDAPAFDLNAIIAAFDKDIDDRLLKAAESRNLNDVKGALKDGANIDATNNYGRTPLMLALCFNEPKIAEFLIEKKANINATCDYGWTPLMFALHDSTAEIAELLIEKGALINVTNILGWTPLMFALACSTPKITKLLIEKGANVLYKPEWGRTVLELAQDNKYRKELIPYLTPLAQDLLTATKKPNASETFDPFAAKYLGLNDAKKVEANVSDMLVILAPYVNTANKQWLALFYNWLKKNIKKTVSLPEQQFGEEQKEVRESLDVRTFCLKQAKEHFTTHEYVSRGFIAMALAFAETAPSSTFNKELHELMQKGLNKNLAKSKDSEKVKIEKNECYKQWESLNNEMNKILDQNNLLASATGAKKLPNFKVVPSNDNKNITEPAANFTDVDCNFEN